MRKTSQDGDSTSAASGYENEIKKPKAGFKLKIISKRTAPNLSEESDQAVIEPLLQDAMNKQILTAEYLARVNPDTLNQIRKRLNDEKLQSGFNINEALLTKKDQAISKTNQSNSNNNAPLCNYMNTNVFHSHGSSIASNTTKSQLLVEIGGCKQSGDNPNPLIFTTAKIHTDGKNMEPVHITPAPIVSTVEVNVSKGGNITTTKETKVSNGTSDMNTLYSQPPVNDKAKDNVVNISNSNVIPVTQINDNILIKTTTNPNKTITKANSPLDIHDSTSKSSRSNITSSVVQKKAMNDKANLSKPSIQSTLFNKATEIYSLPEASKAVNVKDDPALAKDTKDDKKLVDETRKVMNETNIKFTVSDKASINTTKSPVESTKVSESSTQLQINQLSEKGKSAKESLNFDSDPNLRKVDIDLEPIQNKTKQSPIIPKEFAGKSDINATKFPNVGKNVQPDYALEIEKKKMNLSPQNSQRSTEPIANAFSSSTKTTKKSNVMDTKDKDKSPSANEISKSTSKMSGNNNDMLSTNKSPTPRSIVKPAHDVSSPNVLSCATTDTKTVSSSLVSNLKAVTSTTPTNVNTNTMPSSAIKTQSTSTKTATSTGNTKGTSVTSTKSSSKPYSASSIKSPTGSNTITKQPSTSTAKTASGKRPPLAFTKTPQVNISSPTAITPPSKPTVSKIVQVGTSNPAGHKGRSVVASSTKTSDAKTSDASNKTKAPEPDKKGGSKLSDLTKVSKG